MPRRLRPAPAKGGRPKRRVNRPAGPHGAWHMPLIPLPSYRLSGSDRTGAVKGAPSARRSTPLTARTDLASFKRRERALRPLGRGLPTENPEFPAAKAISQTPLRPFSFGAQISHSPSRR